jgi:hypothetical protein
MNIDEQRQTYAAFVTATTAGVIASLYILLALAAVAFASWGTLICWLALIVGTVALIIDARMSPKKWMLSAGGLVFFTLVTVLNV